MKNRKIIFAAIPLIAFLLFTCLPVKIYAASSKLPQAKITSLSVYPWYDEGDQSYYKVLGNDSFCEYYDSNRESHYILEIDAACRKEKGNVNYQFALKLGEKGKWTQFSSGKSRDISFYNIERDKKLYIKARTFKKVNGKVQYGKWSPIVKETTHQKDIMSVSAYSRDSYVKGYIKGAFKGEIIKVKIGKKTYSTKVKKTTKKYPFKIKIGKHSYHQKYQILLCSPLGNDFWQYTDKLEYSNKIKIGFTKKQVRWVWGNPSDTASASGGWTFWYYDDGSVVDFQNGKVKSWYDAAG